MGFGAGGGLVSVPAGGEDLTVGGGEDHVTVGVMVSVLGGGGRLGVPSEETTEWCCVLCCA